MPHTILVWFRRDLRLHDHPALYHALQNGTRVYCAFIFDKEILQNLPEKDRRVEFIHLSLQQLAQELQAVGGDLLVSHADAQQEIVRLAQALQVDAVYANHDYEPATQARDAQVAQALAQQGRTWRSFKEVVVYEKNEVLTQAGQPYTVFTPYKNAWLKRLHAEGGASALPCYHFQPAAGQILPAPPTLAARLTLPTLAELGFASTNLHSLQMQAGMHGAHALLQDFAPRLARYQDTRDFPAIKGPSYLSVHLRFGTISIRELVRHAWQAQQESGGAGAQCWLSELIWREFYHMILYHFPHVVTHSFKPAFDAISWRSGAEAERDFAAWCAGETGYPLVDAAMRQLLHSGYMHNRLRMVTACFLIKDLGIDWRWGEAWFAQHLNDFDLAANNGGWQWAASSGCDAQPWFRIFNPITQSEKFDADGRFILRYLPQLQKLSGKALHAPWQAKPLELQAAGLMLGQHYPHPLVDHALAREQTLTRYAVVKNAAIQGG